MNTKFTIINHIFYSAMVRCPHCGRSVSGWSLNTHLGQCHATKVRNAIPISRHVIPLSLNCNALRQVINPSGVADSLLTDTHSAHAPASSKSLRSFISTRAGWQKYLRKNFPENNNFLMMTLVWMKILGVVLMTMSILLMTDLTLI